MKKIIMALIFMLNASTAFAGISETVNNFGWNYYKNLDKSGNIFYSPYSITAALSILTNGATGDTQAEILSALSANSPENLNDSFKNFPAVNSANLILIEESYSGNGINLRFKNTVEKIYGSEVAIFDFKNHLEREKQRITAWVDKFTNHFIPNYKTIATEDTVMDLLNVIYFKEDWRQPFYESSTRKKNFKNRNGEFSKVDMMHRTFERKISYYADEKYKSIKLRYKNSTAAMYVILPVEERLNIAETWGEEDISYRENFLNKIKAAPIFNGEVNVSLPKFELDIKNNLVNDLKSTGIERAFTNSAEFFNIVKGVSLKIDNAAHQAKIKVDEQGTEAAAVTEVTMFETTALPPQYRRVVEFHADIPFIFVIRDTSGVNLFIGAINEL